MLEKESGKNHSYLKLFKKEPVAPFELFDKNLVQAEEDLQHFKFFAPLVKKLNLAQQGLKAFFRSRARLSLYRRIVSYQNLGFLDKDMLPLSQKRMRGRINREIISTWKTNLSLSENLKPWIPEAEYLILKTAEETGYLQDGIKEIENLLDYETQIKNILRDCAALPIVVLVGVYSLSFIFSHNMAPVYMNIIPLAKWAPEDRLMYYMSHYFTLLFPFVFAGLGLYGWWKNKKTHWYSRSLKRKAKRTPNPDPVLDKLEIMEQELDEEKEVSYFQNRMKGIATFSIFLMMMFMGLVYVEATSLNSMVADSATQSTQNQ